MWFQELETIHLKKEKKAGWKWGGYCPSASIWKKAGERAKKEGRQETS